MAASLPHFPSFPVQENNAGIRWAKWISRLEDLFIGLDIKDKNDIICDFTYLLVPAN
jgi:hypothetical protein